MDAAAPTKKDLLERLLGQGMVMVHVDARREGVVVPADLAQDPDLRLNLSYRFAAGDLTVSNDLVRATLSFGGSPFTCILPLDAVFAVVSHVSGEGFFFPSDAPPEALAALAQLAEEEGDGEGEAPPRDIEAGGTPRRPALRAIDGGADSAEAEEEEASDAEAAPRAPVPLRAVSAPETEAPAPEASPAAAADDDDGTAVSARRPPWLRVVK